MIKGKKHNKNKKFKKTSEGRASVDLEGDDLYKSSPIVTNYYFQYKNNN